MPKYANRVAVTTATTGTGTLTLGNEISDAFCTFAEGGISNAETVRYLITEGGDFEIGIGTYTSSGTTLSRDTVELSKIGGTAGTSKMSLGGTAQVRVINSAADLAAMLVANIENQGPITGGASVTVKDLGNLSGNTITIDPGDRNAQKVTNNGAGTIAPHGSLWGSGRLIIVNSSGAGAITTSGWGLVDGDDFDTINGSVFICGYEIYSEGSVLSVKKVS